MRKALFLVAALMLVAGTFCGGGEKPAATTPAAPASAVANLPAGWPAEAFAVLTKAEIDAYAKVLPNVVAALQKAGFKPVKSEQPDLVKDMGATIESMRPVAGVEDALKAGSVTWESFRNTTYKVMAANNAMAMGLAEAMVKDMKGAEADSAKAELARAKLVFNQVPQVNKDIIFTAMDQLKPLDDIDK